jgi:arylsulfatase A-like enzyme
MKLYNKLHQCILSASIIALTIPLSLQSAELSDNKSQPNVLFIAIDDMNDWIGPLGGLDIAQTPALDKLADQSVTFTNAHCASPACAPSRLAIMTGVQPSKTDVMQNVWYDGPQWRNIPILEEVETIEQFFKNWGYKTLAGGKIYHSLSPPWLTSNQAEAESWDFYFPSAHIPIPYQIRAEENIINPNHFKGKRHPWFTWGPINISDEKMSDYQVVDWAKYELKQQHDKPFFLACGIFRPHMPWEVPQKYFDMYPLEKIPDLAIQRNDIKDAYDHGRRQWHKFVIENDQWKNVIQAYLASITFADAQIGRLLEELEKSNYAENTIVVLWSDHGMHIGEKENWEKFTLWEESTRIPLIFKIPDTKNKGKICNQPVSTLDIYPTLAELAGFKVPKHCDGKSLLPQLMDVSSPTTRSALTSFRFEGGKGEKVGHALRNIRYRYIYYEDNSLEEFYDHQTDPGEFNNLAYDEKYKDLVSIFRKELVSRVDRISLNEIKNDPKGYTNRGNKIYFDSFTPLKNLKLIE